MSNVPEKDDHAGFVGSIPEYYDRYLVPFYFEPFAADLCGRLTRRAGLRVLELACGTGAVTVCLMASLDADVSVTATDLNEAMLDVARPKLARDARVRFQPADAGELPFEDASFDAVVCQFGWMFFPDKARALREAHRVLARGGQLLFNTWDRIDRCPVAFEADAAIRACFPDDPPTFYETPFNMHDPNATHSLVTAAGFRDVTIVPVAFEGGRLAALDAARGIIRGGPFVTEIAQRNGDLESVEASAAARLAARYGSAPFASPMKALVCDARA